jgi:hypothetical protein
VFKSDVLPSVSLPRRLPRSIRARCAKRSRSPTTATSARGPRYSIKEFHDVVLSAGSVPLTVLERQVDDYIASKKAS